MKFNQLIKKNYLSILFFIILLVILFGGLLAGNNVSAETGNSKTSHIVGISAAEVSMNIDEQ